MIISQTPVRISFVGGGSDLPAFYREHGGAVVSTAVDKFVYVTVNRKFDEAIRVSYSKTEEVDSVDQIEHNIVRETLSMLNIPGGVEITSIADIPSRGTGLGSSSAFTVGLLHALHAFRCEYVSSDDLGSQACRVELELCKERIGRQDQYAAAFGGLNFIRFEPDDTVTVQPVICSKDTVEGLERSILVFYTGMTRSARSILDDQTAAMSDDGKRRIVRRMVELAHMLRDELQANNLDAFGEILHENWMLKKEIVGQISNATIDSWYDCARRMGAIGGKLLGAGAGGFLLFYARPDRHEAIRRSLSTLRHVEFRFERRGSRIILFQP
jgi:D-glycero-alpha-D-manno-heptose-7-phosphate kinase